MLPLASKGAHLVQKFNPPFRLFHLSILSVWMAKTRSNVRASVSAHAYSRISIFGKKSLSIVVKSIPFWTVQVAEKLVLSSFSYPFPANLVILSRFPSFL